MRCYAIIVTVLTNIWICAATRGMMGNMKVNPVYIGMHAKARRGA